MNNLFVDSQEISAFIKGTNQIWEGILWTRDDGVRVVLNENGKYKRLSDLDHIKRVGEILTEDLKSAKAATTNLINDTIGKLDPKAVAPKKDFVVNTVTNGLSKNPNTKPLTSDQIKTDVVAAFEKKENEKNSAIAQSQQQMDRKLAPFQTAAQESVDTAAPRIREELDEELLDLIDDPKLTYEDEDFEEADEEADIYMNTNTLSDEDRESALKDIQEMADKSIDEMIDHIKNNYEVSENEAERLVMEVIQPEEVPFNDDVDAAFCEEIDDFDGPPEDLLDHLVTTFEIPEGTAETILIESKFNKQNAILRMADWVRKHI